MVYECLNDKCKCRFKGKDKYMDGLRCPICGGPIVPLPYIREARIYECFGVPFKVADTKENEKLYQSWLDINIKFKESL